MSYEEAIKPEKFGDRKAWYDAQPEPKCCYRTFNNRVSKGISPEEAIKPEKLGDRKAWYDAQPDPKCCYGTFTDRVRKGMSSEEAIKPENLRQLGCMNQRHRAGKIGVSGR
jgi:hypothetical protein